MLWSFNLNELNINSHSDSHGSVYTVHVTNHVSTNATCSTDGTFQFVDGRNVSKFQLVDGRNISVAIVRIFKTQSSKQV